MSIYTNLVTPEFIDVIGEEVKTILPDFTREELEKAVKAAYESPNVYVHKVMIKRISDSILRERRNIENSVTVGK